MNHIYKLLYILSIVALTTITGCSADSTIDEKLNAARDYIETSNYESAQIICDNLKAQLSGTSQSANAETFARLSLLYMKLADADDRQDNVGLAYSCYEEAFRLDSANAAEFYAGASVDDMPLVSILSSIASIVSNRGKEQRYNYEPDSIAVNM